MQPIYPIDEPTVRGHIGKPVVVELHDGTLVQGTIHDARDGVLYLAPWAPGQGMVSQQKRRRNASKRRSAKQGKAAVSAFYPGYGAGAWGLNMGLIASMYLLPLALFW